MSASAMRPPRAACDAEEVLRNLGTRNDIIKTVHQALADHGIANEHAPSQYVIHGREITEPIVGRVLAKGLAGDGMDGGLYVVVDGVDGCTHYVETGIVGGGRPAADARLSERRARSRMLTARSLKSFASRVPAIGASSDRCERFV
ncbi:hypothetical protein AU467_23850 [Mesorhizobium loti]|uniref:Uncharacterized protein n=1 Tax=Rhizobium loti TaxID=381 RepID=A0A101KS49_RHILI|nr:hypothetical protein AU467_23850 [Mesorhizobium loti]